MAINIEACAFEYRIVSNSADTTFNGYDCIMYNVSEATTSYIGTIHDGKIEIIVIALDDVGEAVEKLGLPWEQIMDCRNAMALYSAYSIPEIIIFAPDGTILHRRLRGNDTANKLHQILAPSKRH